MTPSAPVESIPDAYGKDAQGQAARWIDEIKRALKARENWVKRGKKIVKRYKDERPDAQKDQRRMNILWSNVETLKPALYSRTPKPVVARRFLDRDQVGKVAGQILERALTASIDLYDFDGTLRLCVQDYLLPGRGQAWVSYKPTFGKDGTTVAYEVVECSYVPWEDYLECPARHWGEVRWISKRAYLTRDELKKLAGDAIGQAVPLDHKPAGMESENDPQKLDLVAKATVWEIWDRTEKKIYFINPGYSDAPLKVADYPFNLEGGFPCPRPVQTTTATDSRIPVPDYAQYQDQAAELDDLTGRIASLQKALKVVGVYDSSATALQNLLNEGMDNTMVPVDSWAAFAEKGGLKNAVDFLPIDQVAATLLQLYEAREKVKQDLYEVTGLSDIIRGATEASETATAQQIKTQWGSIRVRDRQAEVARFARDILRIKSEIMAEVFRPETLMLMSGAQQMPELDQGAVGPALELLRQEPARNFRIDVETDSTVQPDENAEKERRVEFLTAVGQFAGAVLPVIQAAPPLAPMFGEMLAFGVRGFRAGREVEQAVEQSVQALTAIAQQPPADQAARAHEVAMAKQQQDAADAQAQREATAAQQDREFQQAQAAQQAQREDAKAQAEADAAKEDRTLQLLQLLASVQQNNAQNEMAGKQFDAEQTNRQTDRKDKMAELRGVAPDDLIEEDKMKELAAALQAQAQQTADALTQLAQAIAQGSQAQTQAIQDLARVMAAPRELVRDKQGKPVAARPVLN